MEDLMSILDRKLVTSPRKEWWIGFGIDCLSLAFILHFVGVMYFEQWYTIVTSEHPLQGLPIFFGHKSVALVDLWTLQHVASGVAIGAFVTWQLGDWQHLIERTLFQVIIRVGSLAVLWEGFEYQFELGMLGHEVAEWKDGIEHWANRCIVDPLAVLFGAFVYRRWDKTLLPARWFSLVWIGANVLAPTCMSIQEWLFGQ